MKSPAPALLLLVLAVSVFNGAVFAAEPINGFRGLRWGDPVSSIPNARKTQSLAIGEHCYERPDDTLTMGKATLSDIRYCFYKNRFSSLIITFPSERDGDAIRLALIEAYGVPSQPHPDLKHHYRWRTSKAEAILEYRLEGGAFIANSEALLRERKNEIKSSAKNRSPDR